MTEGRKKRRVWREKMTGKKEREEWKILKGKRRGKSDVM